MEYKLTEEFRGGESLKDRVIEEHGYVSKLTLRELENILARNQETLKEIEGMAFNEQAKIENIEHFHPFVKEMSKEDLFTAAMYSTATINKETHEKNIKALIEAATEATVLIQNMKKQFPELDIEEQEEKVATEEVSEDK